MFDSKRLTQESSFVYITRAVILILQLLVMLSLEFFVNVFSVFKTTTDKDISGQLALVTGGANGLGKEICTQLAKNGCNVAICDINLPAATATSTMLKSKFGIKSKAYKVNVAEPDEIRLLVTKIRNDIGSVDILVNNAGILPVKSTLFEASIEEAQNLINVNLFSNILLTKVFIKEMIKRKRGHIVAISSMASHFEIPVANSYVAAKFGVRGWMKSLRAEMILNQLQNDIFVTTVAPYFMDSNQIVVDYLEKNELLKYIPGVSAKYVAEQTVDAILKNKTEVWAPPFLSAIFTLVDFLPSKSRDFLVRKLFAGVPNSAT